MSQDLDDLPPELEDMSETLSALRETKDSLLQERRKREEEAKRKLELQQQQQRQQQQQSKSSPPATANIAKPTSLQQVKKNDDEEEMFSGLKPGFLFAKPKNAAAKPTPKPASSPSPPPPPPPPPSKSTSSTTAPAGSSVGEGDAIPFIRPKKPTESEESILRFPEVQSAMKASEKPGWVTNDLLSQVGAQKEIMEGLQNPKIQRVLAEVSEMALRLLGI